jgi:hypothetical protein
VAPRVALKTDPAAAAGERGQAMLREGGRDWHERAPVWRQRASSDGVEDWRAFEDLEGIARSGALGHG